MVFSTRTASDSQPRPFWEQFLRLRLRFKGRKENQRRRRWRLMREFYSGR